MIDGRAQIGGGIEQGAIQIEEHGSRMGHVGSVWLGLHHLLRLLSVQQVIDIHIVTESACAGQWVIGDASQMPQ